MALSEIYVDPSIAADSGAGTIGDPYGDLEYAIEQTTFDTTNGTRVNIKAGTDEVLVAELSVAMADTGTSVAWAPTGSVPCIFQGYTTTAGDGGVGGISGGGSVSVYADGAFDGVHFVDLHCHNTGSAVIIQTDDECSVIGCEIDDTSGNGLDMDQNAHVADCYIHNVGGKGINVLGGTIERNFLKNGSNTFDIGISSTGGQVSVVRNNIVSVSGASGGIEGDNRMFIDSNSIYSDGGTGYGIDLSVSGYCRSLTNNIVEGFSGSGGRGIDSGDADVILGMYGGNAVYNCETAYAAPTRNWKSLGDNETLSASPFTDAANDDFSPVDTGNVKEGSLPASFNTG